ncbi:MAG: hypothetical protein LJE96_13595 [Deltaproteobacteria bacterium]|nr:hypothetical protein [Deltaproteobacteria bacterium]
MDGLFNLEINDNTVRFTPDGRISVADAIEALSGHNDSETVLEIITNENPEILEQCKPYAFKGEDSILVADLAVWDKIMPLLAEHLL